MEAIAKEPQIAGLDVSKADEARPETGRVTSICRAMEFFNSAAMAFHPNKTNGNGVLVENLWGAVAECLARVPSPITKRRGLPQSKTLRIVQA